MSVSVRRLGFAAGAVALALVMAGAGFVGGEHLSAQGPGPGGPRGGFGGPGGPGMGRRGPGGPGGGPGDFGMMLRGVDLSQDQRDRVKQIMESHKDEQKALGDRAIAAHEALQDVMTTGTVDETVIRMRAEVVSAVNVEQTVLQARIFSEVYQILTADQQNKLKTAQAERKARREEMKARRDKAGA